jgi:hypothetical protein
VLFLRTIHHVGDGPSSPRHRDELEEPPDMMSQEEYMDVMAM